jgi:putative transposase
MHRYNSFCYPQSGFSLSKNEIKLSKIGRIRIKQHRQMSGTIKTCTLKRNVSGEWDVTFSCEIDVEHLPKVNRSIGIDVGIENFATFNNAEIIENPRFFKKSEKSLAKAQRKVSTYKKGTKERRKEGKKASKIHTKIRNRRKNFCHQESRKIVDKYQNICIEDLNITKMIKGSYYAKSITDVSWNQFRQYLTYKAEHAGRNIGLVNPAYTTQNCNKCGHCEHKKITERSHNCSFCNYSAHRDVNAAKNILALGLDGLGVSPRSPRL